MTKSKSSLLFLLFCCFTANAQVDTIALPAIEINADKIKTTVNTGVNLEVTNDKILDRNATEPLSYLLKKQTGIFVKSYGIGSLATLSARGMGSAHTSVLWNGFNIQNPMHGTIDMSLVPTFFADDLKIELGSSSALYGSGNIGGTIQMNSRSNFQTGFSVKGMLTAGSFNDYAESVQLGFGSNQLSASVKVFNQDAKNNFTFTDLSGNEKKMPNATLNNFGIHQDNYFLINKNQQIETHFWYQNTNRQIPPTLTQSTSDARQDDESFRFSTEWTGQFNALKMNARAAYFDEEILYQSTLIQPALSNSKTYIGELESRYDATRSSIVGGIHFENNNAISQQNYTDDYQQNRIAFFGAYEYQLKNGWQFGTAIRKSITDGTGEPLTGHIGFERKWNNHFILKGNIHKNYRLPTINELFWNDGYSYGNPALLPESSIGQELTLIHDVQKAGVYFSITGFHNLVENWILWRSEFNAFSPYNQRAVRAYGFETKINYTKKMGAFSFDGQVQYTFTKSKINEDVALQSLVGKQLIYTPIHLTRGELSLGYKNLNLSYLHQLTGKRFTSTDNKNNLQKFNIADLQLSSTFKIRSTKIGLGFNCNNLWNAAYEVLAFRPMPMRHFAFSLRFNH